MIYENKTRHRVLQKRNMTHPFHHYKCHNSKYIDQLV